MIHLIKYLPRMALDIAVFTFAIGIPVYQWVTRTRCPWVRNCCLYFLMKHIDREVGLGGVLASSGQLKHWIIVEILKLDDEEIENRRKEREQKNEENGGEVDGGGEPRDEIKNDSHQCFAALLQLQADVLRIQQRQDDAAMAEVD